MKILTLSFTCLCLLSPWSLAADSAPAKSSGSQAVFVLEGSASNAQTPMVAIDAPTLQPLPSEPKKSNKPIEIWSSPVKVSGIPFLLIASMPVIVSFYFAYQIYLFFLNRRKRLQDQQIRHLGSISTSKE